MKRIAIILLLFCSATTNAQTIEEVEQQIQYYLDGISYWRFEYVEEDTSFAYEVEPYDSLMSINNQLADYIIHTAKSQPLLLKNEMKSLDESDITIISSDDKNLKLICWNTYLGGTQHANQVIAIYKHNNIVRAVALPELEFKTRKYGIGHYNRLYTLTTSNKQKYYLAIYSHILSNSIASGGVVAYDLQSGQPAEVDIFQAKTGSYSRIEYEYDYLSNFNFDGMKEEYTIKLAKGNKKLYIPVVDNGQMTGMWQLYNWDGSKFVYSKDTK